jgi:hypothetical protein
MQDSCLDCYRKHIATANVFENEAKLGYPDHKWLAVGELCAGENEVLKEYPALSIITREARIKFMLDNEPIDTLNLIKMATELENS